MAKVRDYHKLALDIIDVVGGQKNIVNATRCATRLRLVLKETPEGAKEKVSALAGVITVVENNGQFQEKSMIRLQKPCIWMHLHRKSNSLSRTLLTVLSQRCLQYLHHSYTFLQQQVCCREP